MQVTNLIKYVFPMLMLLSLFPITYYMRNRYIEVWRMNTTIHLYSRSRECNSLNVTELIQGEWVPRKDLTPLYVKSVHAMNDYVRSKRGIRHVINLRNDSKCGWKYPVKKYPGQCAANSSNPCCNQQKHECGHGPEYCKCLPDCTDYSNIIMPELMEWKETYCPLEDYTSLSTCDFLSKRYSSITFIGDSLVRHFFEAFMIHVTDDAAYGALNYNLSSDVLSPCRDEMQFSETGCRLKLALEWKDIVNHPRYCRHAKNKIKASFFATHLFKQLPAVLEMFEERLAEERPLFLMYVGIHEGFWADRGWKLFLKPLIEQLKLNKTKKPSFLWLGGHTNGPLKLAAYARPQSSRKAFDYNVILSEKLAKYGISVFDYFPMTKDVYSFDGTHFGSKLNRMKVKMLMKLLRYNSFEVR
ncbi:uncharacterized protein LOC130623721 [Hydractinia symbiolongicarpus]|uniref:uncharacterized protein LOC130623721 n=1 Tax=Hydractinia symbiolongicarpus TaxID=13093 RepID=UPI00254A6AF5|nr:uncharacterized protein LOC130623721 [Hydractinia symbiolongicarpus]XP_057295216.1 uncharacterized protein LOC130623721 [Hydractinia symbiolongicarpus]XP_057295217.1 uncharacterized protein LOC130623721 [Hydractinia symbiolongicarpus]